MAQQTDNECETCGGEGELVGDGADRRGEHVDVIERCPDCSSDDYDDRERSEQEWADRYADDFERRLEVAFGPGFIAELA